MSSTENELDELFVSTAWAMGCGSSWEMRVCGQRSKTEEQVGQAGDSNGNKNKK